MGVGSTVLIFLRMVQGKVESYGKLDGNLGKGREGKKRGELGLGMLFFGVGLSLDRDC